MIAEFSVWNTAPLATQVRTQNYKKKVFFSFLKSEKTLNSLILSLRTPLLLPSLLPSEYYGSGFLPSVYFSGVGILLALGGHLLTVQIVGAFCHGRSFWTLRCHGLRAIMTSLKGELKFYILFAHFVASSHLRRGSFFLNQTWIMQN